MPMEIVNESSSCSTCCECLRSCPGTEGRREQNDQTNRRSSSSKNKKHVVALVTDFSPSHSYPHTRPTLKRKQKTALVQSHAYQCMREGKGTMHTVMRWACLVASSSDRLIDSAPQNENIPSSPFTHPLPIYACTGHTRPYNRRSEAAVVRGVDIVCDATT